MHGDMRWLGVIAFFYLYWYWILIVIACGITLCKGGKSRVHYGDDWYDKCPQCGKLPMNEDLEHSTAGRELGFNKCEPHEKTGVRSCSSFTWAVDPKEVRNKKVKDEYGREYSARAFKAVLNECPLRFTDMIGNATFR